MGARRLIAVVLGVAAASAAAPASASAVCANADTTASPSNAAAVQKAVICLVNEERRKRGISAYKTNARLQRAAVKHVKDMAARNFFSHIAPGGSSPKSRARREGYRSNIVGENIQGGRATARGAMQVWMASSIHRANILSRRFKHIGAGYAPDGSMPLWCLVFGRR